MSRTRVLDLAKELGMDTKATIVKLQELGVVVKNHFNAVSDAEADKLRSFVRSGKAPDKDQGQKAGSKVVIRRRAIETPAAAEAHEAESGSGEVVETLHEPVVQERDERISTPQPVAEKRVETPAGVSRDVEVAAERPVSQPIEPKVVESHSAVTPAAETIAPAPVADKPVSARVEPAAAAPAQEPLAKPASTPTPAPAPAPQKSTYSAVIVRRSPQETQPASASDPRNRDLVSAPSGRTYMRSQQDQNRSGQSAGPIGARSQGGWQSRPEERTAGGGSYQRDGGQSRAYTPSGDRPQYPRTGPGQDSGGYRGPRPGQPNRFESDGGNRGPRPSAFVMPETIPGKDAAGPRARLDKDRERERSNKRGQDDEINRKAAAARVKGRHDENLEEFEDGVVQEETGGGEDFATVRTVYAPVPNRRRGGGARKKEHRRAEPANPMRQSKKVIRFDDTISVSDLASELSVKASAIVKSLMQLGMMATVNQILDLDTATLVAQEYGFEVQNTAVSIGEILSRKSADVDSAEKMTRPPVVTVMGHVDHGKTSLLDAIRSADVAAGEAGGITQHIGAYQVECNGRKVSFLDTPGHEAFTAMRARGAEVTDIVVLVVAADDGVMPQTVEAINHAKAAKVPIIVAINKMDKAGINVDRILRELSDHGVMSEDWGGDSIFVKVSAKTREGIDDLLEAILLQADVLELTAPENVAGSGFVIEARLDKSRGPVATLVVTQGTLNMSDWIVAGTCMGRVRAMFNDKGEKLTSAGPATPVEILGLADVPAAGDTFNCVANDSVAKEAVAYRASKAREKVLAGERKATLEDVLARLQSANNSTQVELALIVKGDTQGSVEAIKASVLKLTTEKVRTKVVHAGVGGITESDVILAKAAGAIIIGFNVRPDRMAALVAEQEGIDVRFYSIIYELTDAVQKAMVGCLAPVKVEKSMGRAEVRSLFSVPKIGVIAGSSVTDGKVLRNSFVRVVRDGTVVYSGRVGSLKRFKDDAKEVAQGFECGIGVENFNDLKIGDVLESYVIEETAPTLN
jgi:translation initiation factor IF-2